MSETTASPQTDPSTELRASVDVMFEALAHIQASLTGSTPDEHEAVYRQFKQALYDRYEHAVEQRRTDARQAESDQAGNEGAGARNASSPIPGRGDGTVGSDEAETRPPELDTSSLPDSEDESENEADPDGFSTLWPTD